ncbi:MAG: adenylate kinase family protein [archaeon]
MSENNEINKIIITGCPGTGKTSLAKTIGDQLNLEVIHINQEFIRDNKMDIGFDSGRKSVEVDLEELEKFLEDKKGVIESHLLCEFSLENSLVIVLRCDTKELRERLKERDYGEKKIKENLEAEIFNYCGEEARLNYEENKVYEIDTTNKDVDKVKEEVIEFIDKFNSL